MLVNWHIVNIRFRALMWMIATVLAFVIVVSNLPVDKHAHSSPRAWTASAGLRGRP